MLRLLVVFERDEDGWEVASCPTLPGCHSQGRTRAEALANIREAIGGYLASMREHGNPPPSSSEFQILEVPV
ncbi:MAG: type II toxin-antitoxin system HicB family antitoxin [Chloroflexi bacterium]|nr:type II toxin-antitoxin system HicB family antitoxin [Chloroflexota bacterium]MCY3937143.1 type II toxin-antitoxin system HicB family antitoxin [Chloroflexota bacterium]